MDATKYRATVEKIVASGKHGPYVVAKVESLGSVTFALSKEVWEEEDVPEPGMQVILTKLRRKRAGWRAQHGRFFLPSDE